MLFFVALSFLPVCLSQILIEAPCPRPELQADFDITRYTGKWYQVAAYPFVQAGNGKCITAEYTPQQNGPIRVNNTVFDIDLGEYRTDIGNATVEDPENPAELCVKFRPESDCGGYQVVSTNYEEFSLVHSCGEVGLISLQVNWVLSRNPNPDPADIERIIDEADAIGIPKEYFVPTVQDCGN